MQILKPTWPQPKNIHALTTLKKCELTDLNLPSNKFWIKQEHSINILPAYNCLVNNHEDPNLELPIADGSYTTQKNIICMVKTADCLPILITNLQGNFVAAIHAGWRGLAAGIINNFFAQIKSMDFNNNNNKININIEDLLFWLGPAIGPLAFEVGEDVLEKFENNNLNLYKSAFNKINSNRNSTNNKYLANIYQIAKIALYQCGINNNQIFSENWCTYSRDDLFYSYRREPNDNGRMYSLIWID